MAAQFGATFCLVTIAGAKVERELAAHGEAMAALAGDLTVAREKAESASRGKSRFLAAMSHELRTPLNAIIGFSDVLRKEMFGSLGSTRYREYADHINAAGAHLLQVVNSVLDISKAEAGKLQIFPEEVDLVGFLGEVARLFEEQARAKQIDLAAAADTKTAHADPQALRQILINLVGNSLKFTPSGGMVAVRAVRRDGGTLFSVEDSGCGIPPEDIARVLEPFEQARHGPETKPAEGGTGLGLALADELTRLHGGRLRIESTVGVGTLVTVWLPDRHRRCAGGPTAAPDARREASLSIAPSQTRDDGL
jgi:two-component system cell cycle sensor histidine kinase PleC